MIDSKWYMEAEGQAERSACAEISLNGMAVGSIVEDSLYPNTHLRTCVWMCLSLCLSLRRRRMTSYHRRSAPATTRTWRSATPDMQVGWVCRVVLALHLVYFSFIFLWFANRGASPLSIMSHGSFKCNFIKKRKKKKKKKVLRKVATVRNIH